MGTAIAPAVVTAAAAGGVALVTSGFAWLRDERNAARENARRREEIKREDARRWDERLRTLCVQAIADARRYVSRVPPLDYATLVERQQETTLTVHEIQMIAPHLGDIAMNMHTSALVCCMLALREPADDARAEAEMQTYMSHYTKFMDEARKLFAVSP